jgi:hypothetical protein
MSLEAHGLVTKPLSDIFAWIEKGRLALPELQRPSVWADSKIPRLLSSFYHDYPSGILLVWEPEENQRIRCRPFGFDEHKNLDRSKPAEFYLIDGQQRLTALFNSLHNLPKPAVNVVFNLWGQEFELANKKYAEKDGWFPLGRLLTLSIAEWASLIKQNPDKEPHLNDVVVPKLRHLQPTELKLTYFNVKEKPYCEVAEIFERINLGLPVKKSQIVLGKLSTVSPGIVEIVEEHLARKKLQHGNEFDLDLLMSILAVTATGELDVEDLETEYLPQNGKAPKRPANQLTADVEHAMKAVDDVFAFIDKYLHIDTMTYFMQERTLTCLAFLQAKHPTYLSKPANASRLAYWTAWALLSKRHGDQRDLKEDIRAISKPEDDVATSLLRHCRKDDIVHHLADLDDLESPISRQSILFGFLYALVRRNKAVSFLTTDFVIRTTGDPKKRLHEHHIYPDAMVGREKNPEGHRWKEKWVSDLANFTWLLDADNIKLKDPHISYLRDFEAILPAHLIEATGQKSGDYRGFLKSRRKLVKDAMSDFIEELATNAKQ